MVASIIVVGTSHQYQFAGSQRTAEQNYAFRKYISSMCLSHGIHFLSEEMSNDALLINGRSESSVKQIADELGIAHRYCDPSLAEQYALGIINEGTLKLGQHLEGWSDQEFDNRVSLEHLKREQFWLQQLRTLTGGVGLFVCGSSHVTRFAMLLEQANISAIVAATNWDA
jgi:hypothetical protein